MINQFASASQQNREHRTDLTWFKCGRSEYMRADGVTIGKDTRTGRWNIYLPTGERPQLPQQNWEAEIPGTGTGEFYPCPASGYSLADAKNIAIGVTVDSPAYVAGGSA